MHFTFNVLWLQFDARVVPVQKPVSEMLPAPEKKIDASKIEDGSSNEGANLHLSHLH